nr:helix-turn-helix domain-containing protein [Paracoccaceae bacterium]
MPDPTRPRGRPRTTPADPEQHTVVALDRALSLLEVVSAQPGRSLSDLAEQTGQALATTFRALATLQARGMVEAVEPGPLWHIGPAAFRLGTAYLRRTGLEIQ